MEDVGRRYRLGEVPRSYLRPAHTHPEAVHRDLEQVGHRIVDSSHVVPAFPQPEERILRDV